MGGTDKQKQSLYFPENMLREIGNEAIRLDRSLSWIVQNAWRIAREEVRKFPSMNHVPRPPGRREAASGAAAQDAATEGEATPQVREFLRGKFDRESTG